MQLLIHDLACTEWKLHSRFYENFYESLSFASLRWKFDFSRMYPNFWPNSSSDDRFNLWSKRYTLVIFHLFNKFSNEHNSPVVPMERRTYDWLFRKFPNEQFQRNLSISYFTMFNSMYSSIRRVHWMYRNGSNRVSVIRINSYSRRDVFMRC